MYLPSILNDDIFTPEEIQLKEDIIQLKDRIKSLRKHLDLLQRLRGRPYFNLERLITNIEAQLQSNLNKLYRLSTRYPYLSYLQGKRMSKDKRMSKGKRMSTKRQ